MGFIIKKTVLERYIEEPGVDKVVVPEGITIINHSAFQFCGNIKEVVIPEGVTQIGYDCFASCKALEKVTLPDSLVSIMEDLFYGCISLQYVNIPSNLNEIGKSMFSKCASLKEIIISEGVEIIGEFAFSDCTSLQRVVLPSSLKTIKLYAFARCAKIKDINIADNVQIEEGAFTGCRSLDRKAEYVVVRNELCGYNGKGPNVIIPNQIKFIGSTVFAKNKKIKEVVMPDTVEKINDEGFKGCSALQKVKLSPKLSKISDALFWDCKALEQVEIPEGITIIGENAFRHCYSIKEIKLPYSIKKIQKKAFVGTLESTSTDIHTIIVAPGTNIDEIISPEDKFAAMIGFLKHPELYKDEAIIKSYHGYLAKKKASLLPLMWKNDWPIWLQAFADAGILTNKSFKEFLTEAQDNKAFECTAFLMNWKNGVVTGMNTEKKKNTDTKDPYSVSAMKKKWKFYDIDTETRAIYHYLGKATIVEVPERIGNSRVTVIAGNTFAVGGPYKMANIQEVTVPEGIKKICSWAFHRCSSLKKISLPHTLEKIEYCAFCECTSLTEIELPESLKAIESHLFSGCKALTTVKIPSTIKLISEDAFNYYSLDDPLVRSGKVDKNAINPELTIIAEEGSVAAKYANKKGIKLIST